MLISSAHCGPVARLRTVSTTRRSPPLATWSSDNHMWWCGTSSARGRATPYACSSGARHPRWLPHLAHQPGGATGTLQAEFVHSSRCRGRDAYAQDAARFQFTDIASPNVVTWRRTRATGATAAPTLRDGVSPAPQARAGPHASAPAEYQPWVGVLLTARIRRQPLLLVRLWRFQSRRPMSCPARPPRPRTPNLHPDESARIDMSEM